MNGYNRAYRDPKSPLAPITPRCKSSAFSFEINSESDMSRCSTRKSSCSDYACGDYSCGDYSCGDYSCDDYSCSVGSSDSCSNNYSSCSSKKNSCETYSCSPCSSSTNACSSKVNCYKSSSCSNKSNSCGNNSCSYSNSCNDYSCSPGNSCNSDSYFLPSFNLFKNNGPKFRSFTDLHRNPYQCGDCGKNLTKQEAACCCFTTFKPSKNCMKSNSSCSLNNNYSCFSSGISSSCSRSNSCSDQSGSTLLCSTKSSSCSKLGSLSTFLGYFGSGNTLQVPNNCTFTKKRNKTDNFNTMSDTKPNILKNIKMEKTYSQPIDPQVDHLLQKAGLSKYKSLFEREEIDCLALSLMKTADLKKLNIQDSDIVIFLQVIKDVVRFFQGMNDS